MQPDQAESIRAPIFAILLFEAFALVTRSYLQLELVEDGKPVALAKDLSYLVVPPIMVLMTFPILRDHWAFLATRFNTKNLSPKIIVISVLVGILLRIAFWGNLIGFVALGVYRNEDPNAIVGPLFHFSCPAIEGILLQLLVMSVLVPIIEEVTNRGFILYSFLHRGHLFAIISSSVLFAIYHNPAAIPNAFVIGLFFAVFALKTGCLWPTIIAHATFNGLIVLDGWCLHGDWNPREITPELNDIGWLAIWLGIAALIGTGKIIHLAGIGTARPSR